MLVKKVNYTLYLLFLVYFLISQTTFAVEGDNISPDFEPLDIQEIEDTGQSSYFSLDQITRIVEDDSMSIQAEEIPQPWASISAHYGSTHQMGMDGELWLDYEHWEAVSHLRFFQSDDYTEFCQGQGNFLMGVDISYYWQTLLKSEVTLINRSLSDDEEHQVRHVAGQGIIQRIHPPTMLKVALLGGDLRTEPVLTDNTYQNNYGIITGNYSLLWKKNLITTDVYYRQSNLDDSKISEKIDTYYSKISMGIHVPLRPEVILFAQPDLYVVKDYAGDSKTRVKPTLGFNIKLTRKLYLQMQYQQSIIDIPFNQLYGDDRLTAVSLDLNYPTTSFSFQTTLDYIFKNYSELSFSFSYRQVSRFLLWQSQMVQSHYLLMPETHSDDLGIFEGEGILETALFEFLRLQLVLQGRHCDEDIPYFSELDGRFNLKFVPQKWFQAEFMAEYKGRQFFQRNNEDQLNDYLIFHVGVNQIIRDFQIYVAIQNLVDNRYEPYKGFSNSGIRGFIRFSYLLD